MRIYTKTGDTGQTGLLSGPRVWKDDERIEATGTVDELNCVIGLVLSGAVPQAVDVAKHLHARNTRIITAVGPGREASVEPLKAETQ